MKKWYVFSTPDMVNWTNHGVKLQVEDFDWALGQRFCGSLRGESWQILVVCTHGTQRLYSKGS